MDGGILVLAYGGVKCFVFVEANIFQTLGTSGSVFSRRLFSQICTVRF